MGMMVHTGMLVRTSCWCGIHLAIPVDLYQHAQQDERNHVYCPLGHKFVYSDTSREQLEAERTRRARAEQRVEATRDLLHHEERSHAATKGHLTRQKRRAHAGVCPVQGCKRHFKDLERHMASKHPDFAETPSA